MMGGYTFLTYFALSYILDELRRQFPLCPDYDEEDIVDENGQPIVIGNGVCEHGKEYIDSYMNEDCGWVFGDCKDVRERDLALRAKYPDCKGIDNFFKIGDGHCDGGKYLTEACGWEEYDCCEEDVSKIGDGKCDSRDSDSELMFLNRQCGYESYDCCNVKNLAGNGICLDNEYNLGVTSVISSPLECARDGGKSITIGKYKLCLLLTHVR